MKLSELYEFFVCKGRQADPRGEDVIKEHFAFVKREFDKLSKDEKEEFDREKLINPYTDTRILYGDKNKEVKSIIAGIDMEAGELLLADRLKQKGMLIDLVLSHHPEGRAYANFYEVMHMQADILSKFGVPINIAEGILADRVKEVERKVMSANHTRAVDIARLLDIPFMCVHTPADNCVTHYLQGIFNSNQPERLTDILDLLKAIDEYKEALNNNNGPKILVGDKKKHSGKVFVDMTGGTEGSIDALEKLSQAGVGTIVGMHMSEKHIKNAEKYHINVVIAGHMASDTLGINLLLDDMTKEYGDINIISCSGFKRIKHS